LIIKVLGF